MSRTDAGLVEAEVAAIRCIAAFHKPVEEKPDTKDLPSNLMSMYCKVCQNITLYSLHESRMLYHNADPTGNDLCVASNVGVPMSKCRCSVCFKSVYVHADGYIVVENHVDEDNQLCSGVGKKCKCG